MKNSDTEQGELQRRLLRCGAGLIMLCALVSFFASGYSPPGVCGEVLRHNQANDIDASALFYTDVDNIAELEQGLARLRQERRQLRDTVRTGATADRE